MYFSSVLMHFVKQFNITSDILMERLRWFADGQTCVELFPELNHATLDAIAEVRTVNY
jgi:hypothetical protein